MTAILALDASTEVCSVALLQGEDVDQRVSDAPRRHADLLLPMVDDLLRQHHKKLSDLQAIAFGAGPGSFTGLRICLGTVQGLAFGAGLPLVPVPSLQAMALLAFEQKGQADKCVAAIDARMGEVYWAVYRNAEGVAIEEQPPTVSPVAHAEQALKDLPGSDDGRKIIGVGTGWRLLNAVGLNLHWYESEWWPTAATVARLGAIGWNSGTTVDALHAEPVYLRNDITWEKRTRVRSR